MAKKKLGFDESVEMYLKTIAELSATSDPVPVTLVANRLGISTVSASEMVHRLEEQGLLEHTPYKGVRMTRAGLKRANAVIRRHQLWEVFLYEKLGLSWADTHELACMLEHVAAPQLDEALFQFLEEPERCPHGNRIPDAGDTGVPRIGRPLDRIEPGRKVIIESILMEKKDLLEHMERSGIAPGVFVQILESDESAETMKLRCGEQTVQLAHDEARRVFVIDAVEQGRSSE